MKLKAITAAGLFLTLVSLSPAVNSVMIRQQTAGDFLKGRPADIMIDSSGTLRLARQSQPVELGGRLDGVWSIHTMLADSAGAFYLGTGPNARVLRVADGRAEQVYPPAAQEADGNAETTMLNEHVFALAKDVAGRLLVAVSGKSGKLVRLSGAGPEVVFEDSRVQYIFAVALDGNNAIYLATGPEGLLLKLDPYGQNPEEIYDAKDNSLLSLAVSGGFVYAGGDQRGLIYRIDPQSRQVSVLYDADQDEIPALRVDEEGNVYAAATSAGAAMLQLQMSAPSLKKNPGRPDTENAAGSSSMAESGNTGGSSEEKEKKEESAQQAPPPPAAKAAGHIYKVNPQGFVTDIFSEMAVLYSLTQAEGKLWLGTGNKGQLFAVDPLTEEAAVLYEDKTSSQVTSVLHTGDVTYAGLSNPARLVCIRPSLKTQGVYESDFLDAGQPARWGKLQIEADIPAGAKILMACRSGNVNDPNDQTLSPWSDEAELTQAADLNCPPARFCQYRLTLIASPDGQTPVIRQTAAAHVIPNLAPRLLAVKAERSRDPKKLAAFEISFAAADDNKDALEYKVEFRKTGNTVWIQLIEKFEQTRMDWDTRTVEDGRYEVRVTANDNRSNSPDTALTGSRISDPFIIDNTAPDITRADIAVEGKDVVLSLTVQDALSIPAKVRYTVDSNEKWMTAWPDDLVYDTLTESFTLRIKELKSGRHVVAVMVADEPDNARYKSWEVDVP
jgi:outer membrane protein assembly factor BamB